MTVPGARNSESLRAVWAFEGSGIGVDPHVDFDILNGHLADIADVTEAALIVSVMVLSPLLLRAEGSSAVDAGKIQLLLHLVLDIGTISVSERQGGY